MIEVEPQQAYSYRVTKAVDIIKVPIFNTSQVKYLSALSPLDMTKPNGNCVANINLNRMKCVKIVSVGVGAIPSEWKVTFEPGKKCQGCHFSGKYKRSKYGSIKCARVERAETE